MAVLYIGRLCSLGTFYLIAGTGHGQEVQGESAVVLCSSGMFVIRFHMNCESMQTPCRNTCT